MSVLSPASVTADRARIVQCSSDRKLYLPYSSISLTQGNLQRHAAPTTVHWFVVGRSEPIAPYPTTIQGYQSLSVAAKARAEAMVDELFREAEFQQLRSYLQARRFPAQTSMLTTPISASKPDSATRTGTLRPFAAQDADHKDKIATYRLSDEEGYTLPFTVWGAYIEEKPMRSMAIERSTT